MHKFSNFFWLREKQKTTAEVTGKIGTSKRIWPKFKTGRDCSRNVPWESAYVKLQPVYVLHSSSIPFCWSYTCAPDLSVC